MSLTSIRLLTKNLKLTSTSTSCIRNNSTTTTTIPSSSSSSSNLIPNLTESTTPSASTSTSTSPDPTTFSSKPKVSKRIKPVLLPVHNLPTAPFAKHYPIVPEPGATHVATLQLRSHTDSLERLTFFTSFALRAARALNLPTSGIISLPTKTSLYTTPRSPFAHKKSQENFWKKEHKRAIKVYDGNDEIVRAWLGFLRKEAMGGIGMKAQIISYREPGWGEEMIKVDDLRLSALEEEVVEGSAKEVEMLANEIMEEMKEAEKEAEKVEEVTEPLLERKEAEIVEEKK